MGSVISTEQLETLYEVIKDLYASSTDLPFHGWHHVEFVYRKTAIFAADLKADSHLAQAAALVHDLDYIARDDVSSSNPKAGQDLRVAILQHCGFSSALIADIEQIVVTGEIGRGGDHLTLEAKALSDADCLFKVLPTTPVLFAPRFITQNNYNIRKLAERINGVQKSLVEDDLYFYSQKAKTDYGHWARLNLDLWKKVAESLNDPDIIQMLEQAGIKCS